MRTKDNRKENEMDFIVRILFRNYILSAPQSNFE